MLKHSSFTRSLRPLWRSAASLAVVATVACATPPPPPTPRLKAQPAGAGVLVSPPTVKLASGTSCGADVTHDLGARFQSAAQGALTRAGFRVVADDKAAYRANLEIEVGYCSDAGIVSGTTALSLEKDGASVWRAQATGDQARGETAASTLSELVEQMLDDPAVIAAFH